MKGVDLSDAPDRSEDGHFAYGLLKYAFFVKVQIRLLEGF
jgi:hypothetical protein